MLNVPRCRPRVCLQTMANNARHSQRNVFKMSSKFCQTFCETCVVKGRSNYLEIITPIGAWPRHGTHTRICLWLTWGPDGRAESSYLISRVISDARPVETPSVTSRKTRNPICFHRHFVVRLTNDHGSPWRQIYPGGRPQSGADRGLSQPVKCSRVTRASPTIPPSGITLTIPVIDTPNITAYRSFAMN